MNTVFLVMATLALTTAAQDLPTSSTSTESNQVEPTEDDSDIFKEDEVIEYWTLVLTTAAPGLPILFNSTEPNLVEPSENDDDDWFKEDDVIVYSTKLPHDPVNNFDFGNWDMMNEDNASLFEEYNQTILTEMKRKQNQLHISETLTTTTSPQTDKVATLKGCARCSRCARVRKQLRSRIYKRSACGSKNNADRDAKQKSCTRCSKCVRVRKHTRSVPVRRAVCKLKKGQRTSVNNTNPVASLRSNKAMTSTNKTKSPGPGDAENAGKTTGAGDPASAGDIASAGDAPSEGEDTDGTEYNDDDYDDTKAMLNPCNYEKFEHSLPTIEKTGRRVSDIKCDEYMWRYKIHILDFELNKKKCADQMAKNKEKASEVAGGYPAVQGDFPHMGAVGWIQKNGNRKWMCGSSLISPRFTLTAAHCRQASLKLGLKYTEPKVVRFGSVYLEDKVNAIKKITTEDVEIEMFLVLEEYARYPIKKYNDIGLIKLKKEVTMKLYIKPACLWSGFLGNNWVANVTGWGQTTTSRGSESNHLRHGEVDFVEKSKCKHYIHGHKNRHWSDGLKDHQFCAGKLRGGIDACRGDSGGPLQIRDHWVPVTAEHLPLIGTGIVHHVVGITSFGIQCALPLLPGVYTNVTSFLCWIEKNVWPEENNTFCP